MGTTPESQNLEMCSSAIVMLPNKYFFLFTVNRSDISSPDSSMRAGHNSAEESISDSRGKVKSLGVRMSGHATSPVFAVNGHVPSYPTGDTKKVS